MEILKSLVLFVVIIITSLSLSACGDNKSAGPTVATISFKGHDYIETSIIIKKAGKEISGNYYEVPGKNPNKELALKINKNKFNVLMTFDVWKNTKHAKEFLKSNPALKKSLESRQKTN